SVKPALLNATETELEPIIKNYVDVVVVPTYKLLVTRNVALNNAVRNLANNPSTATFELAANAWMQAREPWEMSEAFLFGPVADLGLDPNMDSWPLDAAALKNILSNGNFQELEWEGEFDEEDETISAAQNVRGFHTLEFLLFYMGEPRTY
ncbi:MAG: peptidase M75, partial [Paludibacteraceae bacterium]|nr:peptidase M75 [Paludibacteraceae bacterium]